MKNVPQFCHYDAIQNLFLPFDHETFLLAVREVVAHENGHLSLFSIYLTIEQLFFTLGNTETSLGARSGEYRGSVRRRIVAALRI
jgi:hypothetical protein